MPVPTRFILLQWRHMNDDIKFILEHAIAAPSIKNCQPWRWVVVDEHTLQLWRVMERDHKDIELGNREAHHVSLGAALQNAHIAASARHYRTSVSYFPDPARELLIASITLTKDPEEPKKVSEHCALQQRKRGAHERERRDTTTRR